MQPTFTPATPPPISPTPGSGSSRKTGLIVAIVIAVMVGVVALIALVVVLIENLSSNLQSSSSTPGSSTYKCVAKVNANGDTSSGVHLLLNAGHCNMADVNDAISKYDIFNLAIPELSSCKPDDAIYTSDRTAWYSSWLECLNTSWDAQVASTGGKPFAKVHGVSLVQSRETSGSACKSDNGIVYDIAAFYCPRNAQIFIIEPQSGGVEYDTLTLLHEYAHHLAFYYGIKIDQGFYIKELYDLYGSKQPEPIDVVQERQVRRSELYAECSSVAMAGRAGMTEATIRRVDWSDENNREASTETHGSAAARNHARTKGSGATSMSSCSAWSWSDADVDR